jgi:aryl-alcohol dehydrogenase-like predicted oxidoreductase
MSPANAHLGRRPAPRGAPKTKDFPDMKTLTLGRTDIRVPDLCLGTMTFGNQTPEDDAHRQIDMSLEAGVNFIDTAEMYPVNPVRKETVGRSEEVIGNWIAKSGRRAETVIATKVSGDTQMVRDGRGYDGKIVREAVDASLRRLKTDVIDVLEAMAEMVKAGKVRAFGLSNEGAWGTLHWISLAEEIGAPRVATVQNEYSLLCRLYDTDMAETSVMEDITLLSFSPLAAGLLTGKYQNGAIPEGSRMAINGNLGGRKTERVFPAVQAYLDVAAKHGLDPVHMAIAWQRSRPFPISAIFGATTSAQLEHILAGKDLVLGKEVIKDLEAAHRQHPMPY